MSLRARLFRAPWRPLILLLAALAWYCARDEGLRRQMLQIRTVEDFAARGREVLWPPWRALLAYVSVDDDVHLYYEFSRVMLGEDVDGADLLKRNRPATAEEAAQLRRELTAKRGVRLPYRDVQLGYPPLALLVMVAPRLWTGDLGAYRVAFAALMAALYLAAFWLGGRVARRGRFGLAPPQLAWRAALAALCIGPLLVDRFDVVPALLLAAALAALAAGRPLGAGVLLVAGAGAKLYPLLLLPTWAALLLGLGGPARRHGRRLLGPPLLLLVLGALASALLRRPPRVLLEHLAIYAQRPIQIESLLGAPLVALGAEVRMNFGSENLTGPLTLALAPVVDLSMILVLGIAMPVAAFRWAARQRDLDEAGRVQALVRFTVATLFGVLLTAKVLSPQYLIWLLPWAVLLPGPGGRRLLVASCATWLLTQVYFPFLFALYINRALPVVVLVLVRNLVLVAAAGLALREALRPARPSP